MLKISRLVQSLLIIGTGLALGGCGMTPSKEEMDVQAGDTFYLNEAIWIKSGYSRVHFYEGKIAGGWFDHYRPHCRIELTDVLQKDDFVLANQFSISKVRFDSEEIDPYGVIDYVYFYITPNTKLPEGEPETFRLTCAGAMIEDDNNSKMTLRPKRQQINQILGRFGNIKSAPVSKPE